MLISHTTVVVNGKLTLDPIFDFEENTILKLITKNNHNVIHSEILFGVIVIQNRYGNQKNLKFINRYVSEIN